MDEQWQTGGLSFDDICTAVAHYHIYPKELHSFHEDDVGPLGVVDLPLYEMPERGGQVHH